MSRFRFLIVPLALCLFFSCKEKKKHRLVGAWQEVAIINPDLDAVMASQKTLSDTMGHSTTAEQNLTLYGTTNIDSFRTALRANLDSFRKNQYLAVKATKFDFLENGIIYIHSNNGVDSSNWYIDEDGALILDQAKLKGKGNRIRMEIMELSDTLLKLHYTEKFLSSTAVFEPIKK